MTFTSSRLTRQRYSSPEFPQVFVFFVVTIKIIIITPFVGLRAYACGSQFLLSFFGRRWVGVVYVNVQTGEIFESQLKMFLIRPNLVARYFESSAVIVVLCLKGYMIDCRLRINLLPPGITFLHMLLVYVCLMRSI